MKPKGKLILIGGNEDKGIEHDNSSFETGVLRRIVSELVNGTESNLEIITTASEIPEEVGERYIYAFKRLGCKNVNLLHIRQREDALDLQNIEQIKKADGVLFSGGDQMRLTMVYGGTEFLEILSDKYHKENFVIAGTSAGAMAIPDIMIYPSSISDVFLKNEIKFFSGLSFIQGVVIDTHFFNRGRFWRLAQVVTGNPGCIGIGLCEDIGIMITEGNIVQSISRGKQVLVLDGHEIRHSNIADTSEGSPLSIEHIVTHILSGNNRYYLKERKFEANI